MNPAQKESVLLFATDTGKLNTSLDAMLYGLFVRRGIEGGHAHRFRDMFAVRLLRNGASLHDVSRLLGITAAVAERHYARRAPELQADAALSRN